MRLALTVQQFRSLTLGLFILSVIALARLCAAGGSSDPTRDWPLPPLGPPGLDEKTIAFIGEDLRNAGNLGVGAGVKEAARRMGWEVRFFDIGSREDLRKTVFQRVVSLRPDGIVLGGVDALKNLEFITPLARVGIPVIGWHAAPDPGPIPGTPVQVNVATDSVTVARAAAQFVIADSKGQAGVVIFTDSRFAIAQKKAATMAKMIEDCKGCTLLEVVDLSLDRTAALMPDTTRRLLREYDGRWQYSLAINDLYFDHAMAALVMDGRQPEGPPSNISAGDGSPSAMLRITYGGYQTATVPEPLIFQGWQLVDEMNRLMQGAPPSGYTTPACIITQKDLAPGNDRIGIFDPANGYRQAYLNSWKRN